MANQFTHVHRRAFTLVELVVVILILGILAGVATPRLLDTTNEASKNAFVTHLFVLLDAFDLYYSDNGHFPTTPTEGAVPPGMQDYLRSGAFEEETPLGGKWVYYTNASNYNVVGVYFTPEPANLDMDAIDAIIDDGDTSTGTFLNPGTTGLYVWRLDY